MGLQSARLARIHAQIASKSFIARELAFGYLTRGRPLKILFSNRDGWTVPLARKLRFTRHEVTFDDIRHADLRGHDIIVPLAMEDLRYLSGLRPAVRTLIPIPALETIDLCDDKLKFHAYLSRHGFDHWLPQIGASLAYPYVLKKCVDEAGAHCHIVADAQAECVVAADHAQPDFFTEEFIPGRQEYASHVLFMGGRVMDSLDIEYGYGTDYPIKGKTSPVYQRLRRCPYLPVFASMLDTLHFEGMCCVNYKLRNGEPVVLEINPRLGRSATGYFFAFLNHLSRS